MSRKVSHSSRYSFPILTSTLERIQKYRIKHEFIPRSVIDAEINEKSVRDILTEKGIGSELQRAELAKEIIQSSRKVFTILVMSRKVDHIKTFLDREIQDCNLPLKLDGNVLRTDQSKEILQDWEYNDLEELATKQWRVLAPVFKPGIHYNFPEAQILPFIGKGYAQSEGGNGRVSCEHIHADHHEFCETPDSESQDCKVAVKKLLSQVPSLFEEEKAFLTALGSAGSHPHLINLLCTYSFKEDNHLVFPYADENLRTYWEQTKLPEWDRQTLLWWLDQMVGIADGLSVIHKLTRLGELPNESIYGRHGDLKADNIIWFKKRPKCTDPKGILLITDLGLAKLHRFESKSNDLDAVFPRTYSPPRHLGQPITQAFDIWSLGCLYLEFVTYAICGNEAINEFSRLRGHDDPRIMFNTDCFYSLDEEAVRPSVHKWVAMLKKEPRCTPVFSDFLDLIMLQMILIKPSERSSAQTIFEQLDAMYIRALGDEKYLLDTHKISPQQELDGSQEPIPEAASSSARNMSYGSSSTYSTPERHGLEKVIHNARFQHFSRLGPMMQSTPVIDSGNLWSLGGFEIRRSRGTWPQAASS
ncbi:kinase-like domain-containing protein [Aspergillus bertholletiae]|uniref:Kinase-like domain-containing protein n=1 Tax=Aspergillus bertholletiae TaxID=1226010 RepID=A0A5N7AW69_9EURO|nr:kinase-like domain-containing protein [Aspergillus bertholletiae]